MFGINIMAARHAEVLSHLHLNLLTVVSHHRDPLWPNGYDAWLQSVSSQVRVSA